MYSMADLEDIGISTNFWHPNEIVSFLDNLLSWVKQNTTEGNTYILSYKGLLWDSALGLLDSSNETERRQLRDLGST